MPLRDPTYTWPREADLGHDGERAVGSLKSKRRRDLVGRNHTDGLPLGC